MNPRLIKLCVQNSGYLKHYCVNDNTKGTKERRQVKPGYFPGSLKETPEGSSDKRVVDQIPRSAFAYLKLNENHHICCDKARYLDRTKKRYVRLSLQCRSRTQDIKAVFFFFSFFLATQLERLVNTGLLILLHLPFNRKGVRFLTYLTK